MEFPPMSEPMGLVQQLRQCADGGPDPFSPFWVDRAKLLMRWAADSLEAADAAIAENYRTSAKGKT
jgi:hypothetical protein